MSQFDTLLGIVLQHEGVSPTNPTGYAWIANDPGGETNWGISQREWSLLKPKVSNGKQFSSTFPDSVKDLTYDQAKAIYYIAYYKPVFDELPSSAALVCFDCEVNEGIGIKILQRAIGVNDDGQWGPQSENALRYALRNVPVLVEELLWQRLAHYESLARPDTATNDRAFLAKFWIPRLIQTRAEAKKL